MLWSIFLKGNIIKIKMDQIFEINTERLHLNRPTENDLEDFLLHINSSEDFSKNLFNISFPFSEEQAKIWFKSCDLGYETEEAIRFAIREKGIGKLIGIIGIHINKEHHKAEIGYWLGKDFWGKGILTETLMAVIQFGFTELKLNKIFATHFLYNPASGKVMQKAGMKYEGLQKQEYFFNGEFLDVEKYFILKQDFF